LVCDTADACQIQPDLCNQVRILQGCRRAGWNPHSWRTRVATFGTL